SAPMANRTPRGRTRRPRNANAAAPLNTRRIIRTNTRIITVSRGQSRRARNAQLRRTEQQEPTERARQAAARQLGQRLGIILEQTQDQYEPEQRHQAPQPLLRSFVDLEDRDEWVDENPIADHAEYFRLQRHAAKREEAARKWAALDKEVVSAYLLYRDISQNWTSWKPDFSEKPKGCTCTLADISHRKVDLVDLQANATTVEQGIARAAECRDIADRLSRHRITIGPHALIDNLDRNQSELLWKAWYSKIDVRQKYLALAEEKQPLLQACRPGEHTTLGISWFFSISFGKFCCRGITDVYLATVGTRANQRLILSGKELHAAIDSYTRYVLAFIAACPTRHAPPTMSYDELLRLQPDDPFWNDGLFTNGNEPWAIDINTQRGIRFLASLKRSREEHRRIGWEARRAMRWAIVQRNQLLKTLRLIDGLQVLEGGVLQVVEGTIIPPDLEPLLSHEYLSPLGSLVEKMKAGKMVVHEKLIEITKLLIEWDAKIVGVFEETPPQTGDDLLLPEWQEQIAQIMQTMQDNTFSNIPGDLHFQVVYPTGRGAKRQ
ncbi:hypothetical protein PSTT_14750, partial [Puccinia striiformis]